MDITKLKNLIQTTKELKVLYVEDNKETRIQAYKMLINFFALVDMANDGIEGLEQYTQAKDNYYDVVISDINMPNMDGIDMAKAILDLNSTQRIMMITAYNDNLVELEDLGIFTYIHKPIKMDTLVQAIEKVIS